MSERKQAPSGARIAGYAVKGLFGMVGRLLATIIMVGIITGCIVASVLTVYILQLIGADEEINLEEYSLGYTSIIYYYDKDGKEQEMQRLYNPDNNRIWVDYNRITKYTKDAQVAIEDKRFWEHQGVDWKRTVGAFVGMFMPVEGTTSGGGSTITQQLIKNITGDKETRVDRKVREIFRAINLSQRYTQEQILEAYLNTVPFGNGTNGIEAAANSYFGKSASELTLAESASIVGITQYPTKYNPFLYPEFNKKRQEHVLDEMLKQNLITQEEHDKAVKEKLNFKTIENNEKTTKVWSYFTDYVVNQVIDGLMNKYSVSEKEATKMLYQGGYHVYTTVDMDIQTYLEKIYLNTDMFPKVNNAVYPQSECVITDINGKIVALVGGIGEKTKSRVLSRATDSVRQPGSSIKPLATYSLAIDNNRVTWSTIVDDHPINDAPPGAPPHLWPTNHYAGFRGNMTIETAINNSVNTVAVKVMNVVGTKNAYDFLKNDLNFHSLVDGVVTDAGTASDNAIAPMAIGALTYGVTPLEMAGGYQIFANGGKFTPPYAYTKVVDSNGRVILQANTAARQVIGEDTSVVMNKLLQRVNTVGTGTSASLGKIMPTAGKTGTTDADVDQWYLGITPYYVCQVWLGYDIPKEMKVNPNTGTRQPVVNSIGYRGLSYPPPVLWKTIMQGISEKQEYKQFLESDDVVSMTYCAASGNLAAPGCPVATGWYKKSRIPQTCSGRHGSPSSSSSSSEASGSSKPASSSKPATEVTPKSE